MRLILVRLGLFAGSVVVLAHWPVALFVAIWALTIWLVPRAYRDRREITRLRGGDPIESPLVAELRSELQVAHAHIEFLQERLEEASQAPSSPSTSGHPLYRRVGLDQDCPKWVAEIVRREYRRRLHPDTKPLNQKTEAERRFKEAEAVFGDIWTMRGFQRGVLTGRDWGLLHAQAAVSISSLASSWEYNMRSRHKGWIVPNEEIPTLLQQIEAKIASSGIDLQHRDTLIRLRLMLEEDLSEAEQGKAGRPAAPFRTKLVQKTRCGSQC